jgi:hypothetical protein
MSQLHALETVQIAIKGQTSSPQPATQREERYIYSKLVLTSHCEKSLFFSFPPENSRIKDRKSRCRYQNNLPAAHRVFLNYPCQKATAGKSQPETTDTAGKSRSSGARKGKARKSRQATTDTAGK